MPVSQVCINARAALAEIYSLKDAFDSALQAAIESGSAKDIETCERLKQALIQKIEQLELDIAPDAYNKQLLHLKILERKQVAGEVLTRDDLLLLYEVNSVIDRSKEDRIDERLNELRGARDVEQDMLVIFECTPGQIAHSVDQINESTKAYIGPLVQDIFNRLPDSADYIYTKFPETRIRKQSLEIGGYTKEQLLARLKRGGIEISEYAEFVVNSPDSVISEGIESVDFVVLEVDDLGFDSQFVRNQEIHESIEDLGLELCSAVIGLYFILANKDKINSQFINIGMKPIADPEGNQLTLYLQRQLDGLWLKDEVFWPEARTSRDTKFIFRLRKKN